MVLTSTSTPQKIVAFEPAPRNLFCLTQTILKLPPRYRDRVALFPVAAGNADGTSQIFAAERNHGHSVVGQPVRELRAQPLSPGISILDDAVHFDRHW